METIWTMIPAAKIFPTMMILGDVAAAVVYGCSGDRGRVMYWLCAAGITFSATYLMD